MQAPPTLRRCVATTLVAIFMIVGGAGDALFYLLELPANEVASESTAHSSFAHDHGDGLWHHHHHTVRLEDRAETVLDSEASDTALAVSDGEASHPDHTCVLLAVLSEVEFSLVAGPPACVLIPTLSSAVSDADGLATTPLYATLGARGPPLTAIV